jgi:hypothetical protein
MQAHILLNPGDPVPLLPLQLLLLLTGTYLAEPW